MKPYEDPEHEWNGSKYYTGKKCIEPGCDRPAGTKWSPFWCQIHNADRINKIDNQFESLVNKK
jgi:hypothetical protein